MTSRSRSRRGSVYVLVLAVSGLVTVLGVSALFAQRVQYMQVVDVNARSEAELLA